MSNEDLWDGPPPSAGYKQSDIDEAFEWLIVVGANRSPRVTVDTSRIGGAADAMEALQTELNHLRDANAALRQQLAGTAPAGGRD